MLALSLRLWVACFAIYMALGLFLMTIYPLVTGSPAQGTPSERVANLILLVMGTVFPALLTAWGLDTVSRHFKETGKQEATEA